MGRKLTSYFLNEKNSSASNNNELVQMITDMVSLSMWSGIRFLVHVYRENSIGKKKPILCTSQAPDKN
jgi:hypothetical protein